MRTDPAFTSFLQETGTYITLIDLRKIVITAELSRPDAHCNPPRPFFLTNNWLQVTLSVTDMQHAGNALCDKITQQSWWAVMRGIFLAYNPDWKQSVPSSLSYLTGKPH
jgi:hypothetical protein